MEPMFPLVKPHLVGPDELEGGQLTPESGQLTGPTETSAKLVTNNRLLGSPRIGWLGEGLLPMLSPSVRQYLRAQM